MWSQILQTVSPRALQKVLDFAVCNARFDHLRLLPFTQIMLYILEIYWFGFIQLFGSTGVSPCKKDMFI